MSVTCTVSRSPFLLPSSQSSSSFHSPSPLHSPPDLRSSSPPLHSSDCSDCSICDELDTDTTTPAVHNGVASRSGHARSDKVAAVRKREEEEEEKQIHQRISNVALLAQTILSPMFGRKNASNKVEPSANPADRSCFQSPFLKRSNKANLNKSASENAISGNATSGNATSGNTTSGNATSENDGDYNGVSSPKGLPGGDTSCFSPKEKKISRWKLKMKNNSSEDKQSESGSFSSADSKTYSRTNGKRKKTGKKSHSRGSSFDYRLIKEIFKMSLPRSLSAGDIGKKYTSSIPEDIEETNKSQEKSSLENVSGSKTLPRKLSSSISRQLGDNCANSEESLSKIEGRPSAKLKIEKTSEQPFENEEATMLCLQGSGLVGLKNLGNTCFMNSIIQCLSHSRPVREYLLSHKYKADLSSSSKMQGRLAEEFASLLADMWSGRSDVVSPNKFKSAVAKSAPRFVGYSQQDSHEFLRFFMEGLHEDLNKGKKGKRKIEDPPSEMTDLELAEHRWKGYMSYDNSSIVDIFVGLLKSTLTCSVCDHKSVTFDPFWDLSLPLPRSRGSRLNLQSCFAEFTQEEILDGDEKPTCENCKKRQRCTKQFSIERFPPILVLHLKRFSEVRYRTKLSTKVDFPVENLDLSDFCSHTRTQAPQYDLVGVSNHSGNTFSGHYIAYCKVGARWHRFSDSSVSGLSRNDIVSSEAYVLFYERKR